LNPRFADVWFNRAALWQRKEEWARAEADFTEYIALKSQHADAYASRGIVRFRQGHTNEARQDFEQCLKLNPNLRQSLEQMIEEAKQQMTRRGAPR
jgi:tetratricopeptide (TPR) repeat protein